MSKVKKAFFCQNCGTQYAKWQGQCSACSEWNTIAEEVVEKKDKAASWSDNGGAIKRAAKPVLVRDIDQMEMQRRITPDAEFNRVLGGGIVPGSLVLIGGEPGIGKSTLLLQIALQLQGIKCLYVSGEESMNQIRMRAERTGIGENDCFILAETSTQHIFKQIEELKPELVVIDSIQTLYSSYLDATPGSVSQIRQCTSELMKFAKESSTPVFLIGHITKDGAIAGPKVLEHMVDTVLQFEGDRHMVYRILRTIKNRFGPTSELGIYEMQSTGLREVSNPSEILMSERDESVSGVGLGATIEGNRPLVIEVQSLVSPATYGTPQRSSTGFDARRLNMLLAVLEKRVGFKFIMQDVFLNIAGGIRVEDPAIDLAVCASLISSLEEIPLSSKVCFAAEVGLGGELRAVNRIENRIREAEKLGFDSIYISGHNSKAISSMETKIEVLAFNQLKGLFGDLFG